MNRLRLRTRDLSRLFRGMMLGIPMLMVLNGSAVSVSADGCGGSAPGAPTISSWSPRFGSPGQAIAIQGSGFSSVSQGQVTIAGVSAAIQSWNDTQIVVTAPAAPSSGQVSICSPIHGTPAVAGTFTYVPQVSGLSTGSGFEGSSVTVSGSYFNNGAAVNFGGASPSCPQPASNPVALSGSSILVHVPAGQCSGVLTVSVPNLDGGGAVTSPQQPAFTVLPHIEAVVPGQSYVGGPRIEVHGTGFGAYGQLSFAGQDLTRGTNWTDHILSFAAPDGVEGGSIQVSSHGHSDLWNQVVQILPHLNAISPTSGAVGTTVVVSGTSFGDGGQLLMGGQPLSVRSWNGNNITGVVPPGTPEGPVTVVGNGRSSVNSLSFQLLPSFKGMSPSSGGPGTLVTLRGTSLGPSQGAGSVLIGGLPAEIALWSDTVVIAAVPKGANAGGLVLTTAAGRVVASVGFQYQNEASKPVPGTFSSGPVLHGEGWVKPPKPPSPVDLTLTAVQHQAHPGDSVDLTVTLKLNGQPVSSAPITFKVLNSPDGTASIDPASATTDANGVAKARLHTSRKPGDNIVLASSGLFSDQDRVATGTPHGVLGATAGPSRNAGFLGVRWSGQMLPFGFAALLAVALIGAGVFLNLRSPERTARRVSRSGRP